MCGTEIKAPHAGSYNGGNFPASVGHVLETTDDPASVEVTLPPPPAGGGEAGGGAAQQSLTRPTEADMWRRLMELIRIMR